MEKSSSYESPTLRDVELKSESSDYEKLESEFLSENLEILELVFNNFVRELLLESASVESGLLFENPELNSLNIRKPEFKSESLILQ